MFASVARFALILHTLTVAALGFVVPVVHAQGLDTGLNSISNTVSIATATDPRIIAGRIINVALGVIGIILVALIVYAGFVWMTSGGRPERIDTAKKTLRNAAIGLVIILAAWAITTFVINALLGATQNGGGTNNGGGGPGGGCVGCTGTGSSFRVNSIVPAGSVSIRNVQVAVIFSKPVDPATMSNITITETATGNNVPVTYQIGGQTQTGTAAAGLGCSASTSAIVGASSAEVVTLTPQTACPSPHQDRYCFTANTDYTVRVTAGKVLSTTGTGVNCAVAGSCQGAFHTGDLVDTQPPTITLSFPTEGMSVSQDSFQALEADLTDDSGVKMATFLDGQSIITTAPVPPTLSPPPLTYVAKGEWPTSGIALGEHSLEGIAEDIDSNQSNSSCVGVVVRPTHCFDQTQDNGETGIDCGGDAQSSDYCGACTGGACTQNSDCSSGVCQAGVCVAKPIISWVSPLDGRPGTFVTISGINFGSTPGTVTFLGDPSKTTDDVVAVAPIACTANQTWTNYQVIVAVPVGAAKGPIEIKNAASTLTDRTDDTDGPTIADFSPDNVTYPGVCGITPSSGNSGQQVTIQGVGFGVLGSSSQVLFGADNTLTGPFSPWNDTTINFAVPVVDDGPYDVAVSAGGKQSNLTSFVVAQPNVNAPPKISEIDPATGPQQQYITIYGTNLGYSVGTVLFTDGVDQLQAIGDTSFPAECSNAFWTNTGVTVKVPSIYKNGQPTALDHYTVSIQRADGVTTNALPFQITTGTPSPGICAISPAIGPANTPFIMYGEHFGIGQPIVTFAPTARAPISTYQDQQVAGAVPTAAITGRVSLTAGVQQSNTVAFQVNNCTTDPTICGPVSQFKCCPTGACVAATAACGAVNPTAEYAWNASTGLIPVSPRVIEDCEPDAPKPPGAPTPSPSPWDARTGGNNAPVDSVITLRFDRPLGDRFVDANGNTTTQPPSTVTPSAFAVSKCTGSGTDPCTTTTPVTLTFPQGWWHPENNQQDDVVLTPAKDLDPSSTYVVTVASSIKADGPGGGKMEVMTSCGVGPSGQTYGYCFRFETRSSTEPTQIGSVNVYPNNYRMANIGDTVGYEADPLAADDRCIVLNCSKFNWNWFTGTETTPDARASITNLAENGMVLCRQTATGNQETVNAPVDVNAKVLQANPIIGGPAELYVNFVPPKVIDYGPNCDSACSNAMVWATFNVSMDKKSTENVNNIVLQKCANENCNVAELGAPLTIKSATLAVVPGTTGDVSLRELLITPKATLDPSGFYRVLLKGGPSVANGIVGLNGVPLSQLNDPQGFAWTFRVKQGADAFCQPTKVTVTPLEKYEYSVFASQAFLMSPYGPADACEPGGEMLVTNGATSWSTSAPNVAALYANGQIDTGAQLPAGCTNDCLASGASGQYGKLAVCGNGIIETTDSNYCKVRDASGKTKTPIGTLCTVMPAGAAAGEECEPSLNPGICDPSSCKFYPVRSVTAAPAGTCGNGVIDPGEMCDFGSFCQYPSTVALSAQTIPSGTHCDGSNTAACTAAGGSCAPMLYRGCTAACQHAGAHIGGSTCGNNDPAGDGKDCDDGNRTDGDGCSADCLHEGSQPQSAAPAVCGNGILEPGETCEAATPGGPLPAGCDPQTCLHTGTQACNRSTDAGCCGNGILDPGEDCDDGNTTSGDGCSRNCLFEGSSPSYRAANGFTPAPSFCSDSVIGTGEQCEAGKSSADIAGPNGINYVARYAAAAAAKTPADMDALRVATANALKAIKTGTPAGDGDADPLQLAYIVAQNITLDADNRASSNIGATYSGVSGQGVYGIQCGFTDESQCAVGTGLDNDGCCRPRPTFTGMPSGTDICRNPYIVATFNEGMDAASVSSNFQLLSPPDSTTGNCPANAKDVLITKAYGSDLSGRLSYAWDSFVQWLTAKPALADKWCAGSITGQIVPLPSYGPDGVTPTAPTAFTFKLDQPLAPQTNYRLRFLVDPDLTDNADKTKRIGIKSAEGVVATDSPLWQFTTGNDICLVNNITIQDTSADQIHPFVFLNQGGPESRNFTATAQSLHDGSAQAIAPIAGFYDWTWNAWTESSRGTLLSLTTSKDGNATFKAIGGGSSGVLTQGILGTNVGGTNGNVMIAANVLITTDTVSKPSTSGRDVQGTAPVLVMTCSDPWPSATLTPFRDALGNPSYDLLSGFWPGTTDAVRTANKALFLGTPPGYYNFSTAYCRDAGAATSTADDLPLLQVNPVIPTAVDTSNGILRQFLFTFTAANPELKSDGIGIRIFQNPDHLSPQAWYTSKGFTGTPTAVTIDGYPALQDGTSIYVAASNRPVDGGPIYSNIYLISHNDTAQDLTKQIYDQMVNYLAFNINMTGQSNVCESPTSGDGAPYVDKNGNTIPCTADWECLKYQPNLYCDSLKDKLARDTARLSEFQSMAITLENAKTATLQSAAQTPGATPKVTTAYPNLASGTYLPNVSVSTWPSWNAQLATSLNLASMPVDPVNKLMACGRCAFSLAPCEKTADCDQSNKDDVCQGGLYVTSPSGTCDKANGVAVSPSFPGSCSNSSGKSCTSDADCVGSTSWQTNANIDPVTCWNSAQRTFICPQLDADNPASVSRIFQYKALPGGNQYTLGAEFEVPPPAAGSTVNWWSPPLPTGVSQCTTPATLGKICTNDADCLVSTGSVCSISGTACTRSADCPLPTEACVPAKAVTGSCKPTGATFQYTGICQNALISSQSGVCGDGVLNQGETCELGQTTTAACTATISVNGVDKAVNGHQQQICSNCTGYVADPKFPQCIPDAVCGNGKIDGSCSNNTALACSTNADCGGATCLKETCDDGVLNGTYGHCNKQCNGYAAFCGDAQLSPGEVCDNGTSGPNANGAYSTAPNPNGCSVDCKGPAPYCGDGKVETGFEQCELGDSQQTQKAVCVYTAVAGGAVTMGGPCDTVKDCAADPSGATTVACGGSAQTNSCVGVMKTALDGKLRATQHVRTCSNSCQYTGQNWSDCEPIGVCGDGVLDPGEECDNGPDNGPTKACTLNCTKNVCGDGFVYAGVEECDSGASNGKATCSAPYGSSCLSCSTLCKFQASEGGYCGDGVKNGAEQCDGTDGLYDVTKPCTGADAQNDTTCMADGSGKYFKKFTCQDYGYDIGSPTCSNSCAIAGCQKCQDATGNGTISGQVFDAIYVDQPVPQARVTLLARGTKVDQVLTDIDGKFTFNNLNNEPQCSLYDIVVDFYGDNVCTNARNNGEPETDPERCNGTAWPSGRPSVDESANNGYWPYTSNQFTGTQEDFVGGAANTDGVENAAGNIYLTPRNGPYESTVVVRWNGNIGSHASGGGTCPPGQHCTQLLKVIPGHPVDAHLYLPTNMAFTAGANNGSYTACTTGTNCQRDIYWGAPGMTSMAQRPFANLFCNTADGSCNNISVAPEVMHFTRKYATDGQFEFWLDDESNFYSSASDNYSTIGLSVEVATDQTDTSFKPAANECGKAWHVFDENATTGDISKPTISWSGVHALPGDLHIGDSPADSSGNPLCKQFGIYCDNPGYPSNQGLPNEEYISCDAPARSGDPSLWPDRDGDGVWDGIDMCPDVPCPAGDTLCKTNTCPPNEPACHPDPDGSKLGCPHPDTDKDGVWDGADQCPTVSWAANCATNPATPSACEDPKSAGCPNSDTDGDGIPNNLDKCPNVPGSATQPGDPTDPTGAYNGCPLIMDPDVGLTGHRPVCDDPTPEVPRNPTCCGNVPMHCSAPISAGNWKSCRVNSDCSGLGTCVIANPAFGAPTDVALYQGADAASCPEHMAQCQYALQQPPKASNLGGSNGTDVWIPDTYASGVCTGGLCGPMSGPYDWFPGHQNELNASWNICLSVNEDTYPGPPDHPQPKLPDGSWDQWSIAQNLATAYGENVRNDCTFPGGPGICFYGYAGSAQPPTPTLYGPLGAICDNYNVNPNKAQTYNEPDDAKNDPHGNNVCGITVTTDSGGTVHNTGQLNEQQWLDHFNYLNGPIPITMQWYNPYAGGGGNAGQNTITWDDPNSDARMGEEGGNNIIIANVTAYPAAQRFAAGGDCVYTAPTVTVPNEECGAKYCSNSTKTCSSNADCNGGTCNQLSGSSSLITCKACQGDLPAKYLQTYIQNYCDAHTLQCYSDYKTRSNSEDGGQVKPEWRYAACQALWTQVQADEKNGYTLWNSWTFPALSDPTHNVSGASILAAFNDICKHATSLPFNSQEVAP